MGRRKCRVNSVYCWQGAGDATDLLQGFEDILSVLVRHPEQMVGRSGRLGVQSESIVNAVSSVKSLLLPSILQERALCITRLLITSVQ